MNPLTDLYTSGIRYLYQENNPSSALGYFQSGLHRDPSACDFIRGAFASRSGGSTIGSEEMMEIYERADTCGEYSRAVDIPVAYPLLSFDMEWMGLLLGVTTPTRIHSIEAIRRTSAGDYTGAAEVLDQYVREGSAAYTHPYGALARTYLHFVTRRWDGVLDHVDPLTRAVALDELDNPARSKEGKPLADRMLSAAGYLMAGTASAHLGRDEEAISRLEIAAGVDNIFIQVEAMRIHALVLRGQGKKDDARQLLAHAASIAETPELRATIDNELDYLTVTSADMIAGRTSYWDASTEPSLKDKQDEDKADHLKDILQEAEEALARQIGMADVKDQVNKLKVRARFNQQLVERGIAEQASTNHLILTGPPGTGKTAIARVIAKIYAGYGIVSDPEVVETSRQDFVGGFEGQSAIKTEETFQSARGKVLFIDEAYELIQDRDGRPDPFGQEAVTVLLQEMENHRDDTVVIIAGYEGDIKRFLATNDGLHSRFNEWIRFSSYSSEELADIAQVIARSRGNVFGDDAHDAVVRGTAGLNREDHRGVIVVDKLGNGRFARNVVETAEGFRLARFNQVADLSVLNDDELMELTREDVEQAVRQIVNSAL